jgi:DNA-binding MarR family transcriptional regulator
MARDGSIPPGIAALGLLARTSDTLAGIGGRLSDWPGAGWSRTTAHKHLPSLERQGFIRRTTRGNVRSLDHYEVTPAGEKHLREWLRSAAEPVQRDAALGRIRLCQNLEDVWGVIEAIRAEEEMSEQAYLEAHARSVAIRRARERTPGRADDLYSSLRDIGLAGEAALWDQTTKRLQHTREELELLFEEHRGGLR